MTTSFLLPMSSQCPAHSILLKKYLLSKEMNAQPEYLSEPGMWTSPMTEKDYDMLKWDSLRVVCSLKKGFQK